MQTAIVYSRIIRQLADKQRALEKLRAEQRLHGIGSRMERPAASTSARARWVGLLVQMESRQPASASALRNATRST